MPMAVFPRADPSAALSVVERATGHVITETVPAVGPLRLAYRMPLRPLARLILFRYSIGSRLIGWYADRAVSRRAIPGAIKRYGLNPREFERPVREYASFNDFFTRRLKPECRPFDPAETVVCSPADCRVLVVPTLEQLAEFAVKGVRFTAPDLLRAPDKREHERFAGGSAAICRLAPADCHRYHFPAAGRILRRWKVPGRYDSVNTLVLRMVNGVLTRNVRRISLLDLGRFGVTAYVQVGAFAVSRIRTTHTAPTFEKMQEKGFFELGGSTIVLLFEPGRIVFDQDLADNSARGLETLLKAGERIAGCAD